MRWPLRLQILLPVAGISIAAVCANAVFAAVQASRRHERDTEHRLRQVAGVLAETSFPTTPAVLAKLTRLTGAQVAIVDLAGAQVLHATLNDSETESLRHWMRETAPRPSESLSRNSIQLSGQPFVTSVVSSPAHRRESLVILYPERDLAQDRWDAAMPAMAFGLLTIAGLVPSMLLITHRLGRRIASVQHKVSAVAEGNYDTIDDEVPLDDEVHRLVLGVNAMSGQLRDLRGRIAQAERARLLGQFAGGLAHQLRNAITGAKLAVQLHRRRCQTESQDDSLTVALTQLALTEQQIRGVLALGRKEVATRTACDPVVLTANVVQLVTATAEHAGVRLVTLAPLDRATPVGENGSSTPSILLDRFAVEAAILNLALNAIEAAGRGGTVEIELGIQPDEVQWIVWDDGDGPTEMSAPMMFEPFVTTKPDGVGLGLALARQVASDHAGELEWSREGGRTSFRLRLPRGVAAETTSVVRPSQDLLSHESHSRR